jgi:hypothetical protein
MKNKSLYIGCVLFVCFGITAPAQSFLNLNFEQASPVSAGEPFNPYAVTVSSALPDWSVSYGGVPQTEINYNALSTGATAVALVGPGNSPLDGNYSVVLTGGVTSSGASISQTGLIPSGTQTLEFELQLGAASSLEVLVGTQNVPYTLLATGPNYILLGANISAWANQTEQLTFFAPESTQLIDYEIDDISFSPTALTPEPNPLFLSGLGGILFAACKWCRRAS